jgi:hypothetical protein
MVRRLSLLLIATLLFAPWSRYHQRSHSPRPSASVQAVGNITPSILTTPFSARSPLINSFSLAGYRLKSENEETDLLIPRSSIRRRPPAGDRSSSSAIQVARFDPLRTNVPLRC